LMGGDVNAAKSRLAVEVNTQRRLPPGAWIAPAIWPRAFHCKLRGLRRASINADAITGGFPHDL